MPLLPGALARNCPVLRNGMLQTYGDAKDASTRLVEFANYGSFVGECPAGLVGWVWVWSALSGLASSTVLIGCNALKSC
jgi:hypothetical protein